MRGFALDEDSRLTKDSRSTKILARFRSREHCSKASLSLRFLAKQQYSLIIS